MKYGRGVEIQDPKVLWYHILEDGTISWLPRVGPLSKELLILLAGHDLPVSRPSLY